MRRNDLHHPIDLSSNFTSSILPGTRPNLFIETNLERTFLAAALISIWDDMFFHDETLPFFYLGEIPFCALYLGFK